MKLLLCKSVDRLGIVGDVVNVSAGYARNFLIPQHLATEPTEANMRRLAEARRQAEQERSKLRIQMEEWAKRLQGVEITIAARANEDGVLYGSVGRKEIADALNAEGHMIQPDQVGLARPIRHVDNTSVEIRFADDLRTTVKLWVVREKTLEDDSEEGEPASAGTEAGTHGDGPEN